MSFADSLAKAASVANTTASTANYGIATTDVAVMDTSETGLIAAYSGDDGDWVESAMYDYYPDYADDNLSTIDNKKNITIDQNQINLTQEKNSQYIPFEMNRYYDGFDLMSATILVYFENKNGEGGYANPINVTYNNSKIRFGWLLDGRATAISGNLKLEIHAIGVNSHNQEYVWKTCTSSAINIEESLAGNGVIEPDETWLTGFLTQVTEQVGLAQSAAQEASLYVDSASAYAEEASNSALQAQSIVDNAKSELEASVESTVNEKVTTALSNYYTTEQVDELLANIDISEQLTELEAELIQQIADTNTRIDNIDGLAAFNVDYDGSVMTFYNGETVIKEIEINSDPSADWVTAYDAKVDSKITTALEPIQTELTEYKTATNADLESIHSEIDGLPETLQNDYYNKEATDALLINKADTADVTSVETELSSVKASVETNKTNINTVSEKLVELETTVNGIDQSPKVTYDLTQDEENKVTHWEITGEGTENEVRTAKSVLVIQGGSGSGSSTILKIEYITTTPIVATTNDTVEIEYNFSGTDSSGDAVQEGTATWSIDGTVVASNIATAGENTFNITQYLKVGSQKVKLSITDDVGSLVTKTWTVQKLDVRLESSFNDTFTYPLGEIAFDYTPYGAISKEVHFVLDGKEIGTVTTSASGLPLSYDLPAQEHGAHLVEVYMTAVVNNNTIESNHIVKDVIWYDATSTVPVIGCVQQKFTARQYDTTNIVYTVYDPKTESPEVTLAVDGVEVSTLTLDSNTQTWQFKSSDVGEHELTITCGETVKTLNVTIEKLDIEINPVTAGLVFDFNPVGKSNNSADRVWSDGTYSMTVSDNFDWVNGGYQIDDAGDQYFCIKAGTTAVIDYQMFADDAKKTGKEMKLIFKTTNVQQADAQFMSCVDNTTGSDHIGIEMFVHEAFIYGSADKLHLKYSENDIIEFEFNIAKNTEAVSKISGYEDGCSTRHLVYDDSFNFTQATPKTITLGSDKCDLHIYRFKVYNVSLTNKGVLNNFIADARNAEEMIDRHNRNQIYDENQALTPEILAEKCPWLRVYVVSAPYFTNKKSDKVPYTTIRQIYKNGDPILDNWTCYDCSHSGQGTSSDNYGAAARNLDFIMNKSQREGVKPYFILGDGVTQVKEISQTRTSIPVAYLNFKANVASSNHFTNALLAKRYNQFNPYKLPYVREDESIIDYIKTTMEFYNAVVFIQETNEDLSTHREFADTDVHFYSIGNIGSSKKTDDTRLVDPSDKYECIVEIMDVKLPLSDWPQDTMMNAMAYTIDDNTKEIIYTWVKDENLGILYELIDGEYVLTTDTSIDLSKTYYVDILEHDDFSEDYTYGWRYLWEEGTDEENAEVFDCSKAAWINLYRFITTSTDEEFKAHFDEYFVKDSAIYDYLFTERYCMTDNRCKNSFWHFGKTGIYRKLSKPIKELLHVYCELIDGNYVATTDTEIDGTKTYYTQYAFDLAFGYDMDTSMSLNNYGNSVYRHGYEDTDVLDGTTEEVFRESDSTFFCRVRDNFKAELAAMFNTLESQNAWHAESFLNEIEEWQNQFPEELWRLDCQKKYIDSYTESFIGKAGDPQFLKNMAQGKMKYAVKQWERSQEVYMASKYQSSVAASDDAILRCTAPEGDLVVPKNYRLKLTPYDYMYLNVKYGTQSPIQVRAIPGVTYEIPFEGDSTDIIDIYSASRIQDLGDLSTTYPATVDTAKATRLKELHVGNSTEGYDNPYLTTMTLGANHLLEVLNVENISGLTQSLNLSELNNLRELYAHGTNAGGVTFANGGGIKIAELPAITALSAKNLAYLDTLDISSYDKLTTLTIENCTTIDVVNIFELASNLNRVRITGIDWTLTDTTLLDRIYNMAGIDNTGYNITQSVLAGKVHVPVMREKLLADYNAAWSDLEITYDTLVQQFSATFQNPDGEVLDIQYVDKGSAPVDPVTREENPIVIPTLESTVSTDFTYVGWDAELIPAFENLVYTAVYSETTREYTIRYLNKGTVKQETIAPYGTTVFYEDDIPTYTAEESAYKYYLFSGWDQSGYVTGNKDINAVYDSCEYNAGYFDGKDISEMRPVEIYALCKLGLEQTYVESKDSIAISFGTDFDYSDIESQEFISEKTVFDGTNYIDTGVNVIEEDRDWTLAIDYKMSSSIAASGVLAQCFQSNGSLGFKLWYNQGVKATWATTSSTLGTTDSREMVVLRHIKGEQGLHVYFSNLNSSEESYFPLDSTRNATGTSTLVFGCMKADDGAYEHFGIGEIHWAKVWYADLGDKACRELVVWTHENLKLEMAGFKNYYLSDDSGKRSSMTFIASHLLDKKRIMKTGTSNVDGWAETELNTFMNDRMYRAINPVWRQLLKQVKIPASVGGTSTEIAYSNCYLTVPALITMAPTETSEPYIYEGTAASFISLNTDRIRTYDGGAADVYWTRSSNVSHDTYYCVIQASGAVYKFIYPNASNGVLVELSI